METSKRKVYFTVGMFFEKITEIDEDLPQKEVEAWADKRAMRIAEDNNMVVTAIEVFKMKEDTPGEGFRRGGYLGDAID